MITFVKRVVKSPKLKLQLEIELNNSTLTPIEAVDRLSFLINSHRADAFSSFIVMLMQETRSSTYEIKKLSID